MGPRAAGGHGHGVDRLAGFGRCPGPVVAPEIIPVRLGESSPGVFEGVATAEVLAAAIRLGAGEPTAGFRSPRRDAVLVGTACELLSGPTSPRLTLLRLSQTEDPLLRDGEVTRAPADGELAAGFRQVDQEIGRLLGCIEKAGRLPNTALLVTGDVSIAPVHSVIQPNVALAAAGLIVPGREGRVASSVGRPSRGPTGRRPSSMPGSPRRR